MSKQVVTGSILGRFGAPTKNQHSRYATLPPEVSRLVDQLAEVEFPVSSKQELLERLGGPERPLYVGDAVVEAGSALMFLPATFFPLASPANLAEKVSDYYGQRSVAERRRDLDAEEVQDLARRFFAENPEVVTATADAVRSLSGIKRTEGVDDDVVADRFVKENQRFVDSFASALSGIGRLRADSRNKLADRRGGGGEQGPVR